MRLLTLAMELTHSIFFVPSRRESGFAETHVVLL